MPTKIFVGNVNPTTKAEQLRVLFEKYGKVTECDIIRNYAFVHMEYDSEAVQAIRQLNGYSVCNSRIRVELSHGKKTENADKKPTDRAFPPRKPLGQGGLSNFNSRFTPGSFNNNNSNNNNNWPDNYDQRPRFRDNFPDYYERDGRMSSVPDRYPGGPMSDRMGSMQDRYPAQGPPRDRMMPPPHSERFPSSQPDRMRPSSPFDRRGAPPPPHAMRDNYYMDRDPYYRERSPLSRMPPDYYDRNMKRDYPPSPYQNNDNMGGFKRDTPMGRDMGMRSMGMDAPVRDQMPSSRGGMEPMRRDNMVGNRGPGPMGLIL
uniref:RRM domain-containing protein n=1 Tax=Octopus bimaculoides TaxID=37653 RepID=A0A0L8HU14_OCTBM